MKPIAVTVRQRGLPARRIVGLFASTTDAVIHTLETLGDLGRGSISAKVLR